MKITPAFIAFLFLLSLALGACGQDAPQASAIKSCGGGSEIGRLSDDDPHSDWTGAFDGSHESHAVHIDLASNGRNAQLRIDGGQVLALTLVARLYCSDSIGMYGDGATVDASKVLVALFRLPDSTRTIKIKRWPL